MVRVSIDIAFYKNELLRMSVSVLRTIELDALQIFKAVVDFGGVTRAAAQLHRVPSNVTTRLKQLEEGLGTKLFHRHSRKLLLSTEGKLLLALSRCNDSGRPQIDQGEKSFSPSSSKANPVAERNLEPPSHSPLRPSSSRLHRCPVLAP